MLNCQTDTMCFSFSTFPQIPWGSSSSFTCRVAKKILFCSKYINNIVIFFSCKVSEPAEVNQGNHPMTLSGS